MSRMPPAAEGNGSRASVLIVDDEPVKRSVLEDELRAAGYQVTTAASALEAGALLRRSEGQEALFDVVVTDLRMPGQDGLSFVRDLKAERPEVAVIVMTAYGTVTTAVEAMKLGAFDYLQKPFTTEELLLKLDQAVLLRRLTSENEALRRQLSVPVGQTRIIGQSEPLRQVLARIHSIRQSDTTVLIEGESGTGKELAARLLHETSARAAGPFVAVACAALPKDLVEAELFGHEAGAFTGAIKRRLGRIELAHGGTLFLDDVDDIPPAVQVKLLRVLQERTFERVGGERPLRVNLRVVAATKRPLAALVAAGKFREDLYYRLNVVPLRMPPLRQRREDIPLLVEGFLERLALRFNRGRLTISPAAVARLQAHHWPGNVRELEHVLEQMVALSDRSELAAEDVPDLNGGRAATGPVSVSLDGLERADLPSLVAEVEQRLIAWAMQRTGGNLRRAADLLNVPRSTLQYKVGRLENRETGPLPEARSC